MFKGYPFSSTTYYRRMKKAKALGCDIMDVPDNRGRHGNNCRNEKHPRWKNGISISSHGYIKVQLGPSHPFSDPKGYAYLHLLVWVSAGNRRPVANKEVVHHINGNTKDNRLENLELINLSDHGNFHLNSVPVPDHLQGREFPKC
jgi:hypothetical protein